MLIAQRSIQPPKSNAVRLMTANKYVANKNDEHAARLAYRHVPDLVAWQEGWQFPGVLREFMSNYRHLTSGSFGGFENKRDAADCITSLHRSHTTEHFSATQVCDAIPDSRVAKNRTPHMLTFSFDAWNGAPLCVINVHLNWVNGLNENHNERMIELYVESVRALSKMIEFVKSMDWIPFVLGDINISRKTARTRDHLTPYDIFKKYGLKPFSHNLDVMAHDPELVRPVETKIIKPGVTGADHPWIVRDFVRV